ncbi:MAG: ABC transporter substrate-binding protein [Holophaga sp.]|nr:ABC transporter substrate-binding protein [Holophaga sp.]
MRFKTCFRGAALALAGWSALGAAEVKLAIILAHTGIGADENLPGLKAAEMAVEEINGAGGLLGRNVELIVVDTGSTPLGSRKAAEYAVSQGVVGVIGAYRSSGCLAMAPVIRAARIPMITPSATNPDVTSGNDFIFRACFTDEFQGRAMAEFARRDLGAGNAVVLTNMTENYCISLARYFVGSFRELDGKVPWEGEYQGSAVDFKAVLAELKRLRPEVVFIPGYPRDSGLLISQAVSSGIRTVFLGADAWDMGVDQYVAGPALEGAYHSDQWHADAPYARNRALKALFQKKYGRESFNSMQIPLTYDSVMLFADAVKRANSLNPERIRQALQQTKGFRGASGSITFDRNRNPIGKDVVIMKFQGGAWRYFKSISPGR